MSEELNQETAPVVVELNAAETKAIEGGWQPKSEWEANPDNEGKKWRDADEFNDRGELFAKIEELNRKSKTAQRALNELSEHHKKVREVEFQRALTHLKQQKKTALEEGDADALIEIDEKIADTKLAQRQVTAVAQAVVPPELEEFAARNKWYSKNQEMTQEADALGVAYAQRNRGVPPSEVFEYVEKRIKALFPEEFKNPNRPKTGVVDSSTSTESTRARGGFTLTDEQERVARNFVKSGIMTRDEYIKELKAVDKEGQ